MTEAKKPKFGRAFTAAINADWMIHEESFRMLLATAARLDPSAVDPYSAEGGWEESEMTVRNGVAIIPVTGPIFRYANLFTYFCGGCAVHTLARDFQAALDDRSVSAIQFEINSPGGEVTGINEFCEMIYNARSIKPITARVGGLGCSAAYWMASACGDIAIDETAMLGSIGVMTVYLDDRKNLEMNGFEELEFISSQSPYKNTPPWKEEGKIRIQRRIDALADVFVGKVARNRDVTVQTVLREFGQGDVFVGQKAVDAGLADRLGSFTETMDLLARTHNPNYQGSGSEKAGAVFGETQTLNDSPTLNSEADVASESVEGEKVTTDEKNTGVQMKNENAETVVAEDETIEIETEETESSDVETEEVSDGSQDSEDEAASLLDAREKALAEREAEVQAREEAVARSAQESAKQTAEAKAQVRKAEFEKVADKFAGDKAAKVSFMEKLADKFGQDSAEFKEYVEDQNALGAQVSGSELLKEIGAPGAETETDAGKRLDSLAKERASRDGISFEAAYGKVLDENRELAAAAING